MMKKFWVVLVMFALVACGGGGVDHEAMKNKVLDAHDEVMPKMGQLMNLKKKVLAKASEMDSTSAAVTDLRNLALELDEAQEGMMVWMRAWSANSKPYVNGEAKPEEITAFYEEEQKKVDKVKADINGAIEKAEKVLQ